MVHHCFGTKGQLFSSVLQAPFDPETVLCTVFVAGPEEVPKRLVRTFLTVWEDAKGGPTIKSLLR